jgi:hypothetical protein
MKILDKRCHGGRGFCWLEDETPVGLIVRSGSFAERVMSSVTG